MSETSLMVMSFFFVNDWGFITSGSSVKEIVRALEIVAKEIIEWRKQNAVTYNMTKIEAMFFFKLH